MGAWNPFKKDSWSKVGNEIKKPFEKAGDKVDDRFQDIFDDIKNKIESAGREVEGGIKKAAREVEHGANTVSARTQHRYGELRKDAAMKYLTIAALAFSLSGCILLGGKDYVMSYTMPGGVDRSVRR